jgi:hypothetical protein
MKHDYLWERAGEPDPEIAHLEQVLGVLRHRARPLALPSNQALSTSPPERWTWRGIGVSLALAATLLLLLPVTWPPDAAPVPWTAEIGLASPSAPVGRGAPLRPNDWIVTDARSRARLHADGVGTVDIEPGSRVRLVRSRDGEHRLVLSRGVLHAQIWAPPGRFYVETPSATAVDLGCAYTLEVDEAGGARLHVTAGWVGLAHDGQESFVPAGAVCRTRSDGTPGTPRLEDASPAFGLALDVLDGTRKPVHANALDVVLNEAREQDAFTLWHLLTRLDAASSERVFARLAELAPLPPGVSREAVLAGDRGALDAWWDSFELGDTRWYRRYRLRDDRGR